MSTYRMTPAERRARAQARIQTRENRSLYNNYLKQQEEEQERLRQQELESIWKENDKNSQGFFVRSLHTIGDIAANVITGAVKGLEGIYDLGAGIVGAVGGIFDSGFQDRVKEHISYDWTMETFGNDWQEALKYSYTDNGGIIEGVASGIGQMLPAVAVTVATGGMGAPAAVTQGASLATMGVSAAGNATEEAFKEGASYYGGLGYGLASGAVEAATEKIFGGATKGIFGKGMADNLVKKSVASTGIKRIAKNALEEGVEEVVAELANPALKSIYKGGEAFDEYTKGEYWLGVGKAGAIGSLTALAYSGSVGYGLSKIGKGYVGSEADINESLMEIDTQKKKAENLFANDKLTEDNDIKISSNMQENYKNIERTLKKANDKKRSSLIEKFSLGSAFETDGTMKVDFATKLGLVANDTQVDSQGQETTSSTLASLLKREYYSPSLRGNEDVVETDLKSITEKLKTEEVELAKEEGRKVREVAEVKPFTGELTEKGKKNFAQTKKAMNYLNGKSGRGVSIVVVDPHELINANIVDDRTIYIGADAFENDTWAGDIVHEYTHFAEGTKEYAKLVDFLQSDSNLLDKAFTSFVNRGYANAEMIKTINEKQARGETLTEQESTYMTNLLNSRTFQSEMGAIMSESLLGTEEFIDTIVSQDTSIAEKIIKKIKNLKGMFEKLGNAEARAEYKRLTKAEKLYLKAIEKAGYKYRNGKILVRREKEEIDSSSQNEYNNEEIQSSRKFRFQHQNFPGEKESGSEAHRLAIWWATKESVVAGDQTLISMNDKWYLVEKFDDADNGYQVEDLISQKEYKEICEEISLYGRSGKIESIQRSTYEIDKLNQQRDSVGRKKSSIDSDETQHGREDNSLQRVGKEESQTRETSSNGRRNSEGGGQDRQIKFSLKIGNENLEGAVDESKNLVALHNLSEEKLFDVLELGGFPMPSIAITKSEIEHSGYGDITVVFGKDTISPTDRRNKIYSADAYTARFPQTQYSLNSVELKKLADRLNTSVSDLEANEFSSGTKDKIVKQLKDRSTIEDLFIKENGLEITPVPQEPKLSSSFHKYEPLRSFITSGITFDELIKNESLREKYLDLFNQVDSPLKSVAKKSIEKVGYKLAQASYDEDIYNSAKMDFENDIRIVQGTAESIINEWSYREGKTNLFRQQDEAYTKFVEDIVSKVVDKKYLRNNKDYYDYQGNPRSFRVLHEEYTAENAVKIMAEQGEKNIEGGFFAYGLGELRAAVSKTFDSIEDLHADDFKIQNLTPEEIEERYDECDTEMERIINILSKQIDVSNSFERFSIASSLIIDVAKTKTDSAARNMIKRDYAFSGEISNENLKAIRDLAEKVATLPVKYFEAKPRRVVGFDEIKGVLLPSKTSKKLIDALEGVSVPYIFYENEQSRAEIVRKMEGIRFSRKGDSRYYYQLSKGQIKKLFANNTHYKVYSKVDAEKIINNVLSNYMSFGDKYGEISGKTKKEVIDMLWQGLNSAQPGYQSSVALNVADYIIQNAVLESMYGDMQDGEIQYTMDIIQALKPYLHNINLNSLKGEISHRYDTDKSPYLLWGKRKGEDGFGADQIAMQLEEEGIYIDAINEADIFFEIDAQYRNAIKTLKKKAKEILSESLSKQELHDLRQDIAKEVLRGFDYTGDSSKLARVVDDYKKKIATLNQKLKDERTYNKAVNRVLDRIQKIKDIKLGTFLNATQYKNDLFKGSIEKLANIKYRGNLNESGTRNILAGLLSWYDKNNPILNYIDEENQGMYDGEIRGMLEQLANEEGSLSTDEVLALENVVNYFIHLIENYNKIYRNGKYVDAQPIIQEYLAIMEKNKGVKVGWLTRIFDKVFNKSKASYLQTFADPITVARKMDMYEEGFYTEMLEALRKGGVNASVMEMNIRAELDEFLSKNKRFAKDLAKRTIEYKGKQIPISQAFLLYMTLNREQAIKGLAYSGFAYEDSKGETHRVDGFTTDEDLTLEELVVMAKAEQETLYKQFSELDKDYIKIAETIFNEYCKEAKRKTDLLRKGYTNVLEGYYVPIRRAFMSKNIDQSTYIDKTNRASNASFNKDTVKGARSELFIEGLDSVLDRHIKAISQYANLSTVIDEYNILYNLNVGDNANKSTSIKTQGVNVWSQGDKYFAKLISDIQGISPVKGGMSKAVGFLRGGYAKYQLGANPKVWATQLTSFFASSSILDYSSIIKGFTIKTPDVDEYCELAKVRNNDNSAAMAQGVIDKVDKVGDILMKPIGMVDRFVVKRLFGACQVQVEKDNGLKVGTTENKKKAGELLERVILETQQNALATEKSAAMRSGSEFVKTLTMFTSDSMKVIGRVIDSIGEVSTLKAKIRQETDPDIKKSLEEKLKKANKKARKSITALGATAIFMALIAQAFRTLYNKDDEDDNIPLNMTVDAIGNLMGGLPLIKDLYAKLVEGYDLDNYAYSAINDLLDSFNAILHNEGKPAQQVKNIVNAIGQIFGIPTRNVYNFIYGITNRISPSTGYVIDNAFYNKNYSSDLAKAIENEDEDMIATIVGIMLDERVGSIEDSTTRKEIDSLVSKGFEVLPKSIGDSITYEGEKITLTSKQREQFKKIYSKANETLASLVEGKYYENATDEVKAKAIKFIYDIYYNLAIEDLLGVDLETKNILFAKAVDIPSLAIIVATARALESDKDKNGKTISGSKKAKVQAYVNSLGLKATQKYMIMGYLGYTNKYGASQVKNYIQRLSLTATQKELLYEYSGYKN